jgi:hypothetical protein
MYIGRSEAASDALQALTSVYRAPVLRNEDWPPVSLRQKIQSVPSSRSNFSDLFLHKYQVRLSAFSVSPSPYSLSIHAVLCQICASVPRHHLRNPSRQKSLTAILSNLHQHIGRICRHACSMPRPRFYLYSVSPTSADADTHPSRMHTLSALHTALIFTPSTLNNLVHSVWLFKVPTLSMLAP